MYNDFYLSHHGILGQKWGVRRFQNEDGSLKSAGKKRYGIIGRAMSNIHEFDSDYNEENIARAKKGAFSRYNTRYIRQQTLSSEMHKAKAENWKAASKAKGIRNKYRELYGANAKKRKEQHYNTYLDRTLSKNGKGKATEKDIRNDNIKGAVVTVGKYAIAKKLGGGDISYAMIMATPSVNKGEVAAKRIITAYESYLHVNEALQPMREAHNARVDAYARAEGLNYVNRRGKVIR